MKLSVFRRKAKPCIARVPIINDEDCSATDLPELLGKPELVDQPVSLGSIAASVRRLIGVQSKSERAANARRAAITQGQLVSYHASLAQLYRTIDPSAPAIGVTLSEDERARMRFAHIQAAGMRHRRSVRDYFLGVFADPSRASLDSAGSTRMPKPPELRALQLPTSVNRPAPSIVPDQNSDAESVLDRLSITATTSAPVVLHADSLPTFVPDASALLPPRPIFFKQQPHSSSTLDSPGSSAIFESGSESRPSTGASSMYHPIEEAFVRGSKDACGNRVSAGGEDCAADDEGEKRWPSETSSGWRRNSDDELATWL